MDNKNTIQEIYKFMGEARSKQAHQDDILRRLELRLRQQDETIDATNKKLDELVKKMTKWESKLGALMFIAGCLWAFFLATKGQILAFIRGG